MKTFLSDIPDLEHRLAQVEADIADLDRRYKGRKFPDDAREQWNELNAERDNLKATIAELHTRRQRLQQLASNPYATERACTEVPSPTLVDPDPWNWARSMRPAERADAVLQRSDLPEHAKRRVAAAMDDPEQRDAVSRWLAVTSDPAYARAFARMVADPQLGHVELDDRERAAWRRVRDEARAMGIGTGPGGGFMVPAHLDPAIMLTSDGSVNPLRRIARVETIATSEWRGVTSAGVTAEWLPEHQEAADASPTVGQPTVPVHKGSAFVPFSVEWEGDAARALDELRRLLLDAADQLMSEAYAVGDGNGQPTGVVNLPAGSVVDTAAADTLAVSDIYGLQEALPPRWQPRAQWCSNLATANEIAQFETTNGSKQFPEIAESRLLRKQWNELSWLDAPGDSEGGGNDNVLLYGDFSAAFLIVDRVGTTLEIIPHLVGPNRRPTGQRGAWLWFRTGSAVIVPEALRLLKA